MMFPPRPKWPVVLYLAPALILLGVFIVYPMGYSVYRSLFGSSGSEFVGLRNYLSVFTDAGTGIALRNTLLWVLVAPALVTSLGLIFAVLTDRIRWTVAVRLVVCMPMAISLFASGVIFRLVYQQDPGLGIANAAAVSVHDVFTSPSPYPGARPRPNIGMASTSSGYTTVADHQPGDVVELPLVGFAPKNLPTRAEQAVPVHAGRAELAGVVWLDVALGAQPGRMGDGKRGMPGLTLEAVRDGTVVATTTSGDDGAFAFAGLPPGKYRIRLPAADFTEPFAGLTWLGPGLVTPVIISAWIWITAGFAMTVVAAGLSAIPREALEAARVDGATEWQVLRRVTLPLLSPVLLVVFVTMIINVLKVFELVFVVAAGSEQGDANVLALQIWQVSFGAGGGDQGLGSALTVVLCLLVIPAMLFNIRRFRRERR